MKDTKVLFTDVDGTLLTDEHEITIENHNAIDKALEKGHKVVINTGRSLASAKKQAEKVGLIKDGCFIISYNGGVIYDCGKREVIFQTKIPLEQVEYLFDKAREQKFHCQTYHGDAVISEKATPELIRYCNVCDVPYIIAEDIGGTLTEEPPKVLVINHHGREALLAFRETVQEWITGKIDSAFSSPYMLEFMPCGVSKGRAIERLCQHLNIPIENTIAAGDGENDITMLRTAHIGAVMKNASDIVKVHGDYITENDNNNSGVAEVIGKFML